MKYSLVLKALAVAMFGALSLPLSAADETLPFHLPLDHFLEIPDDRGMEYFYGVWDRPGLMPGGPMTVKDGIIANYESSNSQLEEPYRVLYTGPNYVLFVDLLHFPEDFGSGVWTNFGVFVLDAGRLNPVKKLKYAQFIQWSCSDYRMKNEAAFEWPREKLMMTFFSGECGKALTIDYEQWFFNSPNHWNAYRYTRMEN